MKDDYQAQDDFRKLVDAHEVKSDKGRHKAALEHGKKKIKAMHAVTQGEYGAESNGSGAAPSGDSAGGGT